MDILKHIITLIPCALASAALAQTTTTFYGCVDKNSNQLTMTTATALCKPNSTKIQWNDPGPKGDKGDTGAPGPQGPAGPGGSQWVDATGAVIGPWMHNSCQLWRSPLGYVGILFEGGDFSGARTAIRSCSNNSVEYPSSDCSGPAYTHPSPSYEGLRSDIAVNDVVAGLIRLRVDLPQLLQIGSNKFSYEAMACVAGTMTNVPPRTCIQVFKEIPSDPLGPCELKPPMARGDPPYDGGRYQMEFVQPIPFTPPFTLQ